MKSQTVTEQRVLEEIAYVAFGRMTDVQEFSDCGLTLKDSKSLPDSVAAAIAEVKFSESFSEDGNDSTAKSVKMHNKIQALNLLAKYFGIDGDFNQARATLKRYGLALLPDEECSPGWRLEKHVTS